MEGLTTVTIPESITGLTDSCKILIDIPKDEGIIAQLDSTFKSSQLEGQIRLPYQRPRENCDTAEIELWYVNETLSKLSWQDLTIQNAGFLIVHYSFLDIKEKLSLQPLLWRFLLFSSEWIDAFSYIVSCYREESKTQIDSIRNFCSELQRNILAECMKRIIERLENDDDYKTNEDRKIMRRVLQWWVAGA